MKEEQVRILVVDDEEGVRNLLQRILQERGYDVLTAADGEEALYVVSQGEADVVLLDIKMPGMSGLEVLDELAAQYPDTCVVMVTAVADTETAVSALKRGAYDYITKPFNRDSVIQKVQEAIQKWSQRLQDKRRYLQLKESFTEQTKRMQEQFAELVNSLAREHRLLHELAARQGKAGKALLSELPQELQEPMASVEEFRNALLRILKKG
ncbi:MAG TPA: response regulator [Dehalococcoidia bacterium]|jgi:DNA-binding NtrC family response regulator|nr:response regulator [Dehalococcoidia bacterium]